MNDGISYSTLDARAMFKLYNEQAARVGRPRLRARPKDRVAMAKALAILMTYRPPKERVVVPSRKDRPPEIREIVIEELCKISHYEVAVTTGKPERIEVADAKHRNARLLISFGFPYSEVLKCVKARLPKSKISGAALRVHAAAVKKSKAGYEGFRLPDTRPYSNKGRNK